MPKVIKRHALLPQKVLHQILKAYGDPTQTLKTIAKRYNVSVSLVHNVGRAGVAMGLIEPRYRPGLHVNTERNPYRTWAVEQAKRGWRLEPVAAIAGVTRARVEQWLRADGVPARRTGSRVPAAARCCPQCNTDLTPAGLLATLPAKLQAPAARRQRRERQAARKYRQRRRAAKAAA